MSTTSDIWVQTNETNQGTTKAPRGTPSVRLDQFNMVDVIEKVGWSIGRSLAVNQQRLEETLAYQKNKELGKKDLDGFDLAKLKGWAHRRNVEEGQCVPAQENTVVVKDAVPYN